MSLPVSVPESIPSPLTGTIKLFPIETDFPNSEVTVTSLPDTIKLSPPDACLNFEALVPPEAGTTKLSMTETVSTTKVML